MGKTKIEQVSEEANSSDDIKIEEPKKAADLAPLFSMFKYLSCFEIFLLCICLLFAAIQGSSMPLFSLLFSMMLDSFSPTTSKDDLMNAISKISMYFIIIAVCNWILCYVFFTLSIRVSEKVGFSFRHKYLEAVLRQETAWFDSNNFQELPTKMSAETEAVQKATGETFSMTVNAIFTGLIGLIIAFIIGWKLAFILLALFPVIMCAVFTMIMSLRNGFKNQAAAYSRSGAYAEQALNSIKVVSAFGQEEIERDNFVASLDSTFKERAIISFKQSMGVPSQTPPLAGVGVKNFVDSKNPAPYSSTQLTKNSKITNKF